MRCYKPPEADARARGVRIRSIADAVLPVLVHKKNRSCPDGDEGTSFHAIFDLKCFWGKVYIVGDEEGEGGRGGSVVLPQRKGVRIFLIGRSPLKRSVDGSRYTAVTHRSGAVPGSMMTNDD